MKLDRLFNVLVLGGAALTTACSASDGKTASEVTKKDDAAAPDTAVTPRADAASPDTTATPIADAAAPETATPPSDATCAKSCTDLGMPCCWMGDCTTDVACKAQLCG